MDETKFKELLEAIRGNGDEALTSVEYSQLIDGFREQETAIAERDDTIEQLNKENEALRDINRSLMVDEGKTMVKKTVVETTEETVEEISDDDIINAVDIFD